MKRLILAAICLLAASVAMADDVPVGWNRGVDGTYVHIASGVSCPAEVKGYRFKSIAGPSDPNFDGICTYENGSETGLIRVRHYVEGVGETPMAIRNDYGLMHPEAVSTGKMVATFRGGPGPVIDGVQTYQIVLTSLVKGFLVDCIARHIDKAKPSMDFPSACENAAGS